MLKSLSFLTANIQIDHRRQVVLGKSRTKVVAEKIILLIYFYNHLLAKTGRNASSMRLSRTSETCSCRLQTGDRVAGSTGWMRPCGCQVAEHVLGVCLGCREYQKCLLSCVNAGVGRKLREIFIQLSSVFIIQHSHAFLLFLSIFCSCGKGVGWSKFSKGLLRQSGAGVRISVSGHWRTWTCSVLRRQSYRGAISSLSWRWKHVVNGWETIL